MLHSWKLAANGVWEEALTLDATQAIDIERVAAWIDDQPQNVAFEAIFDQDDGVPATMFGIRVTSLDKNEQKARIGAMLARNDAIRTEADFRAAAANILPEFPLFSGAPDALNIGIVGQWYSVGPAMIWAQATDAPLPFEALKNDAPRFFDITQNPAAIEFWYTQPADHWYKIYVSRRTDDCYEIDRTLYDAALGRLVEFKP